MPRGYPVTLIVEDRPCLVVGGGPVAARKASGLVECGARVTVVATQVGPDVRALDVRAPDVRALAWEERPYRAGEASAYWLVVTATDDPDVNRVVARDAEEAGVWVNAADDPANCSFLLPAIARQGPVAVAVSTEGASPALASWLRDRLAEGRAGPLGPEYSVLAEMLGRERDEIRAAGRSTEDVDWRAALESDMLELIRAGRLDQARERLQACL